jgi:division protein CdvB (Snf7/Vps24/ESCRT-III family)
VLLRHVGTYTFDFAAQDKLYQDLKALDPALNGIVPGTTVITPQVTASAPVIEVPVAEPELPAEPPKSRTLAKSADKVEA